MLAMSKTHCIPSRITYSIPTSLAVLLEVYRITVQVIHYGLVFQRIRLFGKEFKLATPTICCAPSAFKISCVVLCASARAASTAKPVAMLHSVHKFKGCMHQKQA